MIQSIVAEMDTATLMRKLEDAQVPCGPIYSIKEAFDDPQARHLALGQSVTAAMAREITLPRQPFRLSRTPSALAVRTPEFAEHTNEVLADSDIARPKSRRSASGAISFAFHCIALSHTSPRINFRTLALVQVSFCALFMAASLPVLERPHVAWTARLITALAVAAVLATAAAFSIQSWAQSILPSTHHGTAANDGAGICVDHFVSGYGRAAGRAAGGGSADDPGGDCDYGIDSAASCADGA